jgi:hypothetical protein
VIGKHAPYSETREAFTTFKDDEARAGPGAFLHAFYDWAAGVEYYDVLYVFQSHQSFLAVFLAGFYRPAVIAKIVRVITQITVRADLNDKRGQNGLLDNMGNDS